MKTPNHLNQKQQRYLFGSISTIHSLRKLGRLKCYLIEFID